MKKYIFVAAVLSLSLMLGISPNFAGGKKSKVEPKCPVSNKKIDKTKFVLHNGGKVYFCCGNCPKAFKKKTGKFAAKANMQLVITGQAKEVKCPFTGKKLNPDTKISVQGVGVCFCCFNCQKAAKKLKGAAQVNRIFNDKAFKKGFKVKAAD